jgi:MFS family permease
MILGGALTGFLSWRWSLLINVPGGMLVIAAIGRLVAESIRSRHGSNRETDFARR